MPANSVASDADTVQYAWTAVAIAPATGQLLRTPFLASAPLTDPECGDFVNAWDDEDENEEWNEGEQKLHASSDAQWSALSSGGNWLEGPFHADRENAHTDWRNSWSNSENHPQCVE